QSLHFSLVGSVIPYLSWAVIKLGYSTRKTDFENHRQVEMGRKAGESRKGVGCALKDPSAQDFEVTPKAILKLNADFTKLLEETLLKINRVAQSEAFLADVKKKSYSKISSATVVQYLRGAKYAVHLEGRRMEWRVNASASV